MEINDIIAYLKAYDGPPVKLMEVCGTHTSSIFKNGIRSLISPNIKLISGPGCPVCVTPAAYIDKCIEYAMKEDHVVLTFGDMMKVPGMKMSLSQARGKGASVEIMYSPFEAVEKAVANPGKIFVVAAVGFETTTPAYGLLLEEAVKKGLDNIKLVTALKTMIPALEWICENQEDIDGFICPGHVSVIIGSDVYNKLAEKYHKPFVVAGFGAEHLLAVIYDIVKRIEMDKPAAENLYKNAVKNSGNKKALKVIDRYFTSGRAVWRGLGAIGGSGLYIRDEYSSFDGGSRNLEADGPLLPGCRCADVIVGRIQPEDCDNFGTSCTPQEPLGPCMVSVEGACGIWYRNR